MYDVSGKRAIITGGAQGFGRQFARRLLQKGCRVCITDIDEIKGQEAKKEFQEQFGIKDNRLGVIQIALDTQGISGLDCWIVQSGLQSDLVDCIVICD
jgi:3alpha(or 20beta)-hydroxysteroid dehydrogenase